MAALGFALEGCAAKAAKPQSAPRRPPAYLPVVNASWDRDHRTTIGLRPHRPSGFVLRAEKLDGKTLIHNFGHGGSGMSLSWGTASMAADMALPHPGPSRSGVGIGRGRPDVGARAAASRLRGHDLRRDGPPDTTSNMSLAGLDADVRAWSTAESHAEWDAQFRDAALIAYRRLQLLVGPSTASPGS